MFEAYLTEEIYTLLLTTTCICALTIFCYLLRVFKRVFLPESYAPYLEEAICTFQVVAGVKEGDIILDSHGIYYYFFFVFLLFASFGLTFEGSGCSCSVWEWYLFKKISALFCFIATILQVLGGFLGLQFLKLFWSSIGLDGYHSKMFRQSTEDICESALNSSLLVGMLAECAATFTFSLYSNAGIVPEKTVPYSDALVTSVIVVVGMDYTGMMFNPALATSLTLNCKDHPFMDHVLVYWVAPLLATIVSCAFFNHRKAQLTDAKQKRQ